MTHAINVAIKTMHRKYKPILKKKIRCIYVSQGQATIVLWVGMQDTHDGMKDGHDGSNQTKEKWSN